MHRFTIIVSFLLISATAWAQAIPLPKNYEVIDSVTGDLDKDGIAELVVAYNIRPENKDSFESIPRELIIYKKHGGGWKRWQQSRQALYGSRDGGMMGDPFSAIEIKNGVLLIEQSGGSSWKWSHIDKYRFQQDEFRLIGYSTTFGKPGVKWTDVDFNLVTGKLICNKTYENEEVKVLRRENEVMYRKSLVITLQNRSSKEIKIVTPKYKHEIYVAMKLDQ